MELEFRIFDHLSTEYKSALALRQEILRKPLGLQFTDEELVKDQTDMHLGLFNKDQIVACLTLSFDHFEKVKMRQVAVKSVFQGKGFGKLLAERAENLIRRKGLDTLYCHARKTAVPFYLHLGYKIVSEEFTEVTLPHVVMEKKLK